MNKKIYKSIHKKIGILPVVLFAVGLCICTGCSQRQGEKYTAEDLNNLAEIKIYSAENDELIKTITDEEQLYQYNQCPIFSNLDIEDDQDELKNDLEGTREQYHLISYKYPAARFGEKKLEEIITITLYEDTNIIKMTVAQESIKGFSVPEEYLTFYYEASGEEMDFYRSLAK